ncbi:TPA: hypothetical protein HA361_05450 [Candidatus Woesearchaeota archaeon]|nr:hypothetical protein [Candidatus Woesearchaeota archaeon]HII68304.1 hypothetical protein [Candidatus Woesearchaeota archaeon]
MGFLDFLQHKKGAMLDGFDAPPIPPPSLEDSGSDFGIPPFDEKAADFVFPDSMPSDFNDAGANPFAAKPAPDSWMGVPYGQQNMQTGEPKNQRGHAQKEIFVASASFRAVLMDIGEIKAIVRDAEEAISCLGDDESKKELYFRAWRQNMVDIHRKIAAIDHAIFKKR